MCLLLKNKLNLAGYFSYRVSENQGKLTNQRIDNEPIIAIEKQRLTGNLKTNKINMLNNKRTARANLSDDLFNPNPAFHKFING